MREEDGRRGSDTSDTSNGRIDRRGMMRGMLLGGAAVAGASGCAPGNVEPPRSAAARYTGQLDRRGAEALLASMDKRLAWIDRQTLPEDVVPLAKLAKKDGAAPDIAGKTSLTRKAMRSLYVTGRFADLPDELKAHPGVQARVMAAQADMDDAVLGMTSMLEQMTPEDHRRVQQHLRNDPMLGERIARYVERPAAEDGLPFRRRVGVRSGILELSQRMRAQSPALVTEPLVRKVRRIEARGREDAGAARLLAARVGEEAFWAHQEKMGAMYEAWLDELGPEGVMAAIAPAAQVGVATAEPEKRSRKENTIRTGGVLMGFGAGSIVLGLAFWGLAEATGVEGFIWPAIVLGVTVGPILLIVGLVILIVGAAMSAE